MNILAGLWPFKKRLTPEHANQKCPGSGSLWEGKYRRTRCSTSNGLERHLPGDYQTSVRYFAHCPECKVERAITKGKRLFVKHTRSSDYHTSHLHIYKYALEMESRREGYRTAKIREDRSRQWRPPIKVHSQVKVVKARELHKSCGKPLPRSREELAEFEKSYEAVMAATGIEASEDRYYCTCGMDPEISVA